MVKLIGIVACSAEGAALCYRTICIEGAEHFRLHGHPEVSMHTHSIAAYVHCLEGGDWQGIGELMIESASKLASIGADFTICPDNTIHLALPDIESRSPLRWRGLVRRRCAEPFCGAQRIAGGRSEEQIRLGC